MALPANLLETTQVHLDQLVTDHAQEGPHLDFKRELPTTWDQSTKQEFLADISAFANAGGGDVIYGVDEDGNAQASAVVPQVLNPDQEVRRLQDFLLTLVEPRLPGVQVHPIAVNVNGTAGHVIVVRAPQSWAGPHRVKPSQHFYLREGARKRPLDVPEIRGMFLRSENQSQRVRDFRTERISRILTGEAPHKLAPGSLFVLHLIPTQAALGNVQVDPLRYDTANNPGARRLPLLARTVTGNMRFNLDGALCLRNPAPEGTHGYSLLFRNGFFEAVNVEGHLSRERQGLFALDAFDYEQACVSLIEKFRVELSSLGLDTEMTAMLTLLHADRAMLTFDRFNYGATGTDGLFDRKHLILPDVLIAADAPLHQAMRPMFDLIWQAGGLAGSINYDAQGSHRRG